MIWTLNLGFRYDVNKFCPNKRFQFHKIFISENREDHMSLKRGNTLKMMSTNLAPKKGSNFKCYFMRTRAESGRYHVTEKGKTLGRMSTNLAPQKFQFHQMLFSENQGRIRKGKTLGFMSTNIAPTRGEPLFSTVGGN